MKILRENKWIILIALFSVICLFFIQDSYMMAPDEYNYSNITWTPNRLSSFGDVFKSLHLLYTLWTGRIFVHGIIQMILFLGDGIYKVLNPIMFLTFIYLIYKVSNKDNSSNKSSRFTSIASIIVIVLYFINSIGEKIIWLSGSINYLWTCTIMLSIIYFYKKILLDNKKLNRKSKILFFILSFFSGWTQENVVFVLGSFIAVCVLFKFKEIFKDKEKRNIVIISIVLFMIGVILLIFAPGNFKRFGTSETTNIITTICNNFNSIISNFIKSKFLLSLYVISVFFVIMLNKKENKIKEILKIQTIYCILPVIIALTPMLVIGEFPIRAMFPYEVLIIISIMINLNLIYKKIEVRKIIYIISTVLSLLIIYDLGMNLSLSQKYMKAYKDEVNFEVNMAKISDKKDVVVSVFEHDISKSLNQLLLNFGPTKDKNNIINTYMAIYYGFDSICAISKDEYIIKITFEDDKALKESDVIDIQTGECISTSYVYDKNNEIYFIIPKEKLGIYKLKMPDELKGKDYKITFSSITESFELNVKEAII